MAEIYIVEDDSNISEIEEIALRNSGHSARCFEMATEFFDELEEHLPDLIVLDVMLPDMDGYAIVKKLRSRQDTKWIPVIMVTAKTSEVDLVRGLDIGADDYLKKPFSVIELITRVKALLRRSDARLEKEAEGIVQVGDIVLDDVRHSVLAQGDSVNLTYKEFELLKYLMENTGRVLSRERIMEHVWETDFEGESRTIDMHIKSLRKKLGDSGNHIRTVRNVGYVMDQEIDS